MITNCGKPIKYLKRARNFLITIAVYCLVFYSVPRIVAGEGQSHSTQDNSGPSSMESVNVICRLCLGHNQDTPLHNLFGKNLISMKIMSLFQLTVSSA